MILKNLSVRNFRNIASADFTFHPKRNLFIGNNAQGKTNLCEAVSVCFGKSFRTAKPAELVPFSASEEDETTIRLVFSFEENDREHVLLYKQKKNRFLLTFNGLEIKKAEELYGALRYVSFIPEDLNIVKGSPEIRRNYLDFVSNMMNRVHQTKLYEYQKALKQKNNLLSRTEYFTENTDAMIQSWNETLARLGVNVMCGRLKYFRLLNQYAREYYEQLNQNEEKLCVNYESSVMKEIPYDPENVFFLLEIYSKRLSETYDREKRMGYTVVGVHRDDLGFSINGRSAKDYASQGQVRSIAIALKLAEARMIRERSGNTPVIILDDVLSELDAYRRRFVLNHIEQLQTFLTSCQFDNSDELNDGKIWRVNGGGFIEEK